MFIIAKEVKDNNKHYTIEESQYHAENMNKELENFDESKWNMLFWKQKPEEWVVINRQK